MAKFASDTVMDQQLLYLEANAGKLTICQGQPADYSEATTALGTGAGKMLAEIVIDTGDFTGPVNGDTSGRKTTINQQTGITIATSGTANHIAVVKTTATTDLLLVTTCTSQSVTAANTATVNSFDDEVADPA